MKLEQKLVQKYAELARIPAWNLDRVLRLCRQDPVVFAQHLVTEDWIGRDSAGRMLADALGFTYVSLRQTLFDRRIVEKLPREIAEEYAAIPLYQLGDVATVVMSRPYDATAIQALQRVMMTQISPVFSFPDEIERAIRINYDAVEDLDQLIAGFDLAAFNNIGEHSSRATVEQLISSKQIVKLAETIILIGIKNNASDIHIEAKRHCVRIRYRLDGIMKTHFSLPKELAIPLSARLKVMANVDIIEKRKPQDGRISFLLAAETIDIRVSMIPTLYGEKLVLRIIGTHFTRDMLHLDRMSFMPDILAALKAVLRNPNGLLLVSGPTGSGKTTTLYAALNYVNSPDINVVTIEDPIEYDDPEINQIHVNPKEGRSFENVLRSVLRQDPDVILVGEIRDVETARTVAQAALTGHLVLTTVHTGSALQALTRLIEMGVERFIVAPSIIGVMGQRLLRRLCEFCKESYEADAEELATHFYWRPGTTLPKLFRAMGCVKCQHTGYQGRIAIHEFLRVDPVVRQAILQDKQNQEIAQIARGRGFRDVRYDGFRKALMGLTTLDEVCRITTES